MLIAIIANALTRVIHYCKQLW